MVISIPPAANANSLTPLSSPARDKPEFIVSNDVELLYAHHSNNGMLYITESGQEGQCGVGILFGGRDGVVLSNNPRMLERVREDLVDFVTDAGTPMKKVAGDRKAFLAKAVDSGLSVAMIPILPQQQAAQSAGDKLPQAES